MRKIIILLFLTPLFIFGQNSENQEKGKLLIGIVVDQMKQSYLSKFNDNFGEGGFKRLYQQGFVFQNAHYNYKPTYTAPGHATIYTGTTPSVHGIVANNWYDRKTKNTVYCVHSMNELGEKETNSSRLKSNTIADMLKLHSNFRSKAYAIALKDRAAILAAGHLSDAAYWFNSEKGKWLGSPQYSNSHADWLTAFNDQNFRSKYIQEKWTLELPKSSYHSELKDQNKYEAELYKGSGTAFPYNLNEGFEHKSYALFNRIPAGNQMTFDLAKEIIEQEQLGKNKEIDFLAISFSATDYIGHLFGTTSREVEDAYVKLDRDLARFLNFLDEVLGKDNYLLFLSSDHGAGPPPLYLKDRGGQGGIINTKVLSKDLDSIFDNEFGEAKWIEAFTNFNFYFNHEAIQKKSIQVEQLLEVASNYLMTQEGIADVYHKSRKIKDEKYHKMIENGLYPKASGDLIILEQANYTAAYPKGSTHGSPYSYDTAVPLIFFGAGIKSGKSNQSCAPIDIVPTLSALLNIPLSDGAKGKPLFDF